MRTLLALAAIAALGGCYRTRFDLAPPAPETRSMTYGDHYHFSLLNIIEMSAPVELQQACDAAPPSAIEEQIGPLGAVFNAVFATVVPIIHIQNATLYCMVVPGQPPAAGPPPPQQYAVPPPPPPR